MSTQLPPEQFIYEFDDFLASTLAKRLLLQADRIDVTPSHLRRTRVPGLASGQVVPKEELMEAICLTPLPRRTIFRRVFALRRTWRAERENRYIVTVLPDMVIVLPRQ